MGLGGVISSILSLGATLLPAVSAAAPDAPSMSSASPPSEQNQQIEIELKELMRLLERINATLYDAERKAIIDKSKSVELWIKELERVAYDAEDVLDEYQYEVLRAQLEARAACPPDSSKRKLIQVPDGMLDQIKQIRRAFDEIAKDRDALQLFEEDGLKRSFNHLQIAPTSHFIDASCIFGREKEKDKLIDKLSSESRSDKKISVVPIVGTGGLGKTTLAQLVYDDRRVKHLFDAFGWVCVSDNFDVARLTKELLESLTGNECGLTSLSALQMKISKVIRGKRIFLVLDDVWNENNNLWELFQAPLRSAASAKILVTTRNDHVARIVQTTEPFYLEYLSEEQCWQLFQHYAFSKVNHRMDLKLVEIGEEIMKKCGRLPLALKSIASLLRHQPADEESWREILESELWDTDACDEIFRPLQLSYVHLPTYLKPCLIFCSMFPKDYEYRIDKLVQLWISHGYIESKRNKCATKIGLEYGKQLWQRSFFEHNSEYWWSDVSRFKLHDIIHDLARFNSKSKCCNPVHSNELCHLYVEALNNIPNVPIPFDRFTALRTLIAMSARNYISTFDLSMLQKLRVLRMELCDDHELELVSTVGTLKHLRDLCLGHLSFEKLPECICSLYHLQNLKFKDCNFHKLPTSMGNLVSLQNLEIECCYFLRQLPKSFGELKALRTLRLYMCKKLEKLPTSMGDPSSLETIVIDNCYCLKRLPESFCQLKALRELSLTDCRKLKVLPGSMDQRLTNLRSLTIIDCGVQSLPPRFCNSIVGIQIPKVILECIKIEWLKNLVNLGGTLTLGGLGNVSNLTDIQCANISGMQNLKCLKLTWTNGVTRRFECGLWLYIKRGQGISLEKQSNFEVMAGLQPHPNLRELDIDSFGGDAFPEWIGNPGICASLEKIEIWDCENLKFLPFGSLCKLKKLSIGVCRSLQIIRAESLLQELEKLCIEDCGKLICISGIPKLKSLVKLRISRCDNLGLLLVDIDEPSDQPSSFLCVESCQAKVEDCPLLWEWCLRNNIKYKGSDVTDDEEEEDEEDTDMED